MVKTACLEHNEKHRFSKLVGVQDGGSTNVRLPAAKSGHRIVGEGVVVNSASLMAGGWIGFFSPTQGVVSFLLQISLGFCNKDGRSMRGFLEF